MKRVYGRYLADGIFYIAGSLLYALSVNIFTAPNNIAPGGFTGVATLLNHIFGVPIGTTMLIMNIPLLLMAWKRLGLRFAVRTGAASILVSLLIDAIYPFVPAFRGDTILTVVFGGVLAGAGLGLIYMRGGTTGGSELIARLLGPFMPHIPTGRIILTVDAVVVASSILVFHNFESALYAMIMIFVSSSLMDTIIYGRQKAKMLIIFTRHEDKVADAIMEKLQRGVTFLEAKGAYTKEPRNALMCAVRPQEVYELHLIVRAFDPDAFIVVTPADDVVGEGFSKKEA